MHLIQDAGSGLFPQPSTGRNSPSLTAGGMGQRASRAGEAPQQSGGNDGHSPDSLNIQSNGRTNGRPAEAEHRGVRLLRTADATPDLHELTQVRMLSAVQQLLQGLTHRRLSSQ